MSKAGLVDPIEDVRAASCSDGAPSARNLIVTVFGDVVLPAGADTELTVADITSLLAGFGVNERLVRTSLSRIVGDGLLTARSRGRRSFYRVHPDALDLFRTADRRIYRPSQAPWDGAWTLVVLDGTEASPARRARLRQELAWAGLGTVAPNVMASPVVAPEAVTDTVARVGGFSNVLVTRSTLHQGEGVLGRDDLVRRALELDELEASYDAFADRFSHLADTALARLDDALALKTRLLVVATFRRIALVDPQLPPELLPAEWAGAQARRQADRIYRSVGAAADREVARLTGLSVESDPDRFAR
jgi:phenylacetic acid degradation operon negative regulatory protein